MVDFDDLPVVPDPTSVTSNVCGSPTKEKKRLSFSSTNELYLIPSRKEIREEGLIFDLWYCRYDYITFKSTASAELRKFMSANHIQNARVALVYLYQPDSFVEMCQKKWLLRC